MHSGGPVRSDFQNQRLPIRAWRWLLHRPRFAVLALLQMARWGWRNPTALQEHWGWYPTNILRTRREVCGHLWTVNASMAHFQMGASLPLSVMLEELRKQCHHPK